MNKKIKIWLIVAVSFMLIGGIIFVGAMSMLNWNFMGINTTKYETNETIINDSFKNISINTNTSDIIFLKSSDQNCKVDCFEHKKEKHIISVQNETLIIEINNTRKWYDYIQFFSFNTPKITVYLPQEKYETLSVKVSTGDIKIPSEFQFDNVDVKASTGDVQYNAATTGNVKINLSTGRINIENADIGNMNLKTTTGNINVKSVDCSGKIEAKVSTGKVELTNVKCESLISNGNTGDIKLTNTIAANDFNITRSTGDIKLIACDAGEIFITTDTGDVSGTLLTDKVFICKTDTGDIDVPKTTNGGICEITTDTGDIEIIKIETVK